MKSTGISPPVPESKKHPYHSESFITIKELVRIWKLRKNTDISHKH